MKKEYRGFYKVIILCLLIVLIATALAFFMLVRGLRGGEEVASGSLESQAESANSEMLENESERESETESEKNASQSSSESETRSEASENNVSIQAVPFEQNSIDHTLELQLQSANNAADAVKIYNEQVEAWKTELKKLVTTLARYDSGASEEQQKWEREAAAQIAEKEKECESAGGSFASLDLAVYVYECYQSRAQELYEKVIALEPSYQIGS